LLKDPTFRLIGSEKIWERGAALPLRCPGAGRRPLGALQMKSLRDTFRTREMGVQSRLFVEIKKEIQSYTSEDHGNKEDQK